MNMTQENSCFHERHAELGSIVLKLCPKIMQIVLKGHMKPRVLKTKHRNKNLHVALTDTEIALMEQLPNLDNFTIGLCYKILRFEQLVDDPKSDWENEPHDAEIEIADDIKRIIYVTNEFLGKKTNDITVDYYAQFTKKLSEIVRRVDTFLEKDTCHTLYQDLWSNKKNIDILSCLKDLENIQPIVENEISKKKEEIDEECRRRDRVSRIACVIIDKFPYFLRCILKKQNTPGQVYSKVAPHIRTFRSDQQCNLQDMSSLGTFDSLDTTLLYQLIREYATIQPPTKGWGEHPVSSALTIGDDIERIRIYRNKFAHRSDIKMKQYTFEDYFYQFIGVSHRIDVHLGNNMNPSCEQEVINCKTCHMDADLQIKYENSLKRLENVILRFVSKPIKFCYGDSFESCLKQLRSLIKEETLEGNTKIRIQIIVGDEAEMNEAAQLLNEMKDEINRGLIGIELKEAYTGSVVLEVQIDVMYVETDIKLECVISRLMERILHLGIFKLHQTKSVEAVLVPNGEYNTNPIIAKKESLSEELDSSSLYLDFEVDAEIFETDERLHSNLLKTVTNVLTKSNGKGKQNDVTVTLLPISLGNQMVSGKIQPSQADEPIKIADEMTKDPQIHLEKISSTIKNAQVASSVFSRGVYIGDKIIIEGSTSTLGGLVKFFGKDTYLSCSRLFNDVSEYPHQHQGSYKCRIIRKKKAQELIEVATELNCQIVCSIFTIAHSFSTSIDAALIQIQIPKTPNLTHTSSSIPIKSNALPGDNDQSTSLSSASLLPDTRSMDLIKTQPGDYVSRNQFKEYGLSSIFLNDNYLDVDDLEDFKNQPVLLSLYSERQEGWVKVLVEKTVETIMQTQTSVKASFMNPLRMYNQLSLHMEFRDGDSGKCIYGKCSKSGKIGCIGMLVGLSSSGLCVVTPLKDIFEAFKIIFKKKL